MIDRNRVAVVMPMFNEVRHIARTISGIPVFVDMIVVVDDGSTDGSGRVAAKITDPRVHLVKHRTRQGVGAALRSGLAHAVDVGADLIVTMDADGQMAPSDLMGILEPLSLGRATYVKGNRFAPEVDRDAMPWIRRLVNMVSSAYFRRLLHEPALHDVHCGYTAMTGGTAASLVAEGFHDSYGVYNDILARVLTLPGAVVAYVPVEAVYGDERSHLRIRDVVRLGGLVLRMALSRGMPRGGFGRPTLRAHRATQNRALPVADSQQAA